MSMILGSDVSREWRGPRLQSASAPSSFEVLYATQGAMTRIFLCVSSAAQHQEKIQALQEKRMRTQAVVRSNNSTGRSGSSALSKRSVPLPVYPEPSGK